MGTREAGSEIALLSLAIRQLGEEDMSSNEYEELIIVEGDYLSFKQEVT